MRILAVGAFAALPGFSRAARAQQAPAPPVESAASAQSEVRAAPAEGPPPAGTFAPVWLTLSGGLFTQSAVFHGCESRADASGNSHRGFALQRHSFLRLLPGLTFHRFSMAGCAVDAGMGNALSYALPVRRHLWLMPSAGVYRLPSPGGESTPLIVSAARVDLVQELPEGRTLSVGLGTRSDVGQFHALHFSGSF